MPLTLGNAELWGGMKAKIGLQGNWNFAEFLKNEASDSCYIFISNVSDSLFSFREVTSVF